MSHVTTRKSASTDEKDKRLTDSSPVPDMKKKVAANAEKEKMAAEKQNGGDKTAEKKDKQPERQVQTPDKKDGKQNGDKNPEKTAKASEKQNGDKPKEKSAEKPVEKKEKTAEKPVERKEKAVDKPADKKENEKAKEDSKGEKSTKPDDKPKPKPAEKPQKADKPVQNVSHHNGVTDVTLSANGGNDVTLQTTVSGDSDSEDMVIVIDDQENDELFPELTYDDTSDNEGFESQEFRSATRRSQAKATRTPETPRPASVKQGDPAALATNTEKTENAPDAGKGKPLSKGETKALLEFIEKSRIITTKTTNAICNRLKNEEWNRIAEQFNATASITPRTPAQLRLKWENMKKNARRRSTSMRMNHLKTGGGAADYIPPDEILDRVTSLLGSTGGGFVVPFGDDGDPEGFSAVGGSDNDCSDWAIGLPPINLDKVKFEDPLMARSNNNIASVSSSEILLDVEVERLQTPQKPKRVTFTAPRSGKRKMQGEPKNARDIAISEYYIFKKKCLEAKLEGILLENKNLKLQNENLKLQNEKLKLELNK